jgi:hypothetical protein
VSAGAFFALASAKPKKERESAKKKKSEKAQRKKSAKKATAPIAKEKTRIHAFPPTHSGNPVSEPKTAWQEEKQGS